MGYVIECMHRNCKETSYAKNIVDLIENHTANIFKKHTFLYGGKLTCPKGHMQAAIVKKSRLQETGETWKRWIKAVVRMEYSKTYYPYFFLVSSKESSNPDAIHFNYYKDTRASKSGKLKHGHGPGGGPVLDIEDLPLIMTFIDALGYYRISEFKKKLGKLL